MSTVKSIIERLCPDGTNRGPSKRIDTPPVWPPDLFAIAATIVNKSGCYALPRYMESDATDCMFREEGYAAEIKALGEDYGLVASIDADGNVVPKESRSETTIDAMQELWDTLLSEPSDSIESLSQECADAAIKLMMIADEASVGIGFVSTPQGRLPYAELVFDEHAFLLDRRKRLLPYLPYSLCLMIPSCELCVQPKTMTAQVGCTLRSLSHHLALLPPMSEVATKWLFGIDYSDLTKVAAERDMPLNLLLVPFPYSVDGICFKAGPSCLGTETPPAGAPKWHFFDVDQQWLKNGEAELSAKEIAQFLFELVELAKREVPEIHGVILPEIALTYTLAEGLADELARLKVGIELLMTGVTKKEKPSSPEQRPTNRTINGIQTYLFLNSKRPVPPQDNDATAEPAGAKKPPLMETVKSQRYSDWFQSKHHRWKLERSQITRYNLGGQLDHGSFWWERTNIHDRSCTFYTCRPGMSLAALVCEDLARIDPVQTAIRSIGPNLVIALLMDGAQAEHRWSGRYATVLADDPGSAVLTLTSLGLLRRSEETANAGSRQIGLWKGAEGVAKAINLSRGKHAVLITLTQSRETNSTIDGRLDNGATHKLWLSATTAVSHPNPPAWATVD